MWQDSFVNRVFGVWQRIRQIVKFIFMMIAAAGKASCHFHHGTCRILLVGTDNIFSLDFASARMTVFVVIAIVLVLMIVERQMVNGMSTFIHVTVAIMHCSHSRGKSSFLLSMPIGFEPREGGYSCGTMNNSIISSGQSHRNTARIPQEPKKGLF